MNTIFGVILLIWASDGSHSSTMEPVRFADMASCQSAGATIDQTWQRKSTVWWICLPEKTNAAPGVAVPQGWNHP